MRTLRLILPLLLLVAAACNRDGTSPGGPSWFRASLSGEVSDDYEGKGDFSFRRDHADSPHYFRIGSKGLNPAISQRFFIRWPNDRRPAPGTYALVRHLDSYGSPDGVTAVYVWSRGDNVDAPFHGEVYVATAGEIEITRSTDEEVEGRITFTGIQVTMNGPTYRLRDDPRYRPDPAAPTIAVTGSFRVTRFDEDKIVVH